MLSLAVDQICLHHMSTMASCIDLRDAPDTELKPGDAALAGTDPREVGNSSHMTLRFK